MDADQLHELIKQAGLTLLFFAPASAALLVLVRKVWAFRGEWAAVVAGLINVAAVTAALLGVMPSWVYVVAAALIATATPAVAYDVATRAGNATKHEDMLTEFDANVAGGPGAEGA